MGDQRKGGISWTEQSWNPIRGCSRVSAGCERCYAMGVAARFSGPGQPYEGLAVRKNGLATWTGKVVAIPEHLEDPIRWRRPRRIFVNSMSDLFHEDLPRESIAEVFAVMATAKHHQFQVLTKRSWRMLEVLNDPGFHIQVSAIASARSLVRKVGLVFRADEMSWPLPNVWLGVSAEDQETADRRIPDLLASPAAIRWVSAEPLLGPIDCSDYFARYREVGAEVLPPPDWIVVGGESQPGCREMDLEWLKDMLMTIDPGDTRRFVKQLGGHPNPRKVMAEWPEDLRVQEYPDQGATRV